MPARTKLNREPYRYNVETYVSPGEDLVETVRSLLIKHNYNGPNLSADFGVGYTFYSDFMRGRSLRPHTPVLQMIYEVLTNKALIEKTPGGE